MCESLTLGKNEFFNTIVYFKSNTVEEIEINCIFMTLQCDCNLTQGVSIFTPASIFYDILWGVKFTPPPRLLGFKFLLLDRLSKALVQLFLVC